MKSNLKSTRLSTELSAYFKTYRFVLRVCLLSAIATTLNFLFPLIAQANSQETLPITEQPTIASDVAQDSAQAQSSSELQFVENLVEGDRANSPNTTALDAVLPLTDQQTTAQPESQPETSSEDAVPTAIGQPVEAETTQAGEVTPSNVSAETTQVGEVTPSNSSTHQSEATPTTEPINPQATMIVFPAELEIIDSGATTVIVRYPINSEVTLSVNGQAVDAALVGRTETDEATGVVTQTWYGITLGEGENVLAVTTVRGGNSTQTERKVMVRGTPTAISVEPLGSGIPADGRSTVTLQGELLDANGNRANRDSVVTLEVSRGEFAGTDFKPDQPGFQVQATEGQFSATLRSSLETGIARIRAISGDLEAFNQVEFETSLRPTLLAGQLNLHFGRRGTDYFASFRDFLPADGDNDYELDLQAALFGTTQLGEWQLTGAYNSDRPLNRACDGSDPLFREGGECEHNYPVYGDGSTTDVTTPSTDQVFLRIARTSPVRGAGSDFIQWGDFTTSEQFAQSSQLFTATTRELHGLFANYNLGDLRITGFYGNNVEGFQRDAIAPDGTSGFYFVSRRLLVEGSENVFIETEELNRPGTVIQSEQLSRGADYQIDYDRGSILFNEPILKTGVSESGEALVRRIIVSYQYETGEDANIYGGRLQYSFSRDINRESWIGATYIRENQGSRHFELYGADALIPIGADGRLIAEYAHSTNDSEYIGTVEGSAYRIELQGSLFDDNLQARLYYRSTDAGFANNATSSFVPGQTRYGAEVQATVTDSTTLRVAYDHEDNFGTAPRSLDDLSSLINPGSEAVPGRSVDNSLTTITAGIQQRIGSATLGVDWIHRDRQDRLSGLGGTSDQLRSRLSVPIVEDVTFRAQNELTLSADRDAVYPDRTVLGVDWAVTPGITLSLNHQFYSSRQGGDNAITSLDLTGEYHLTRETILNGRFSFIPDQGIKQGIQIAPGLRADLAYEHIFASNFEYTGAGARFPQPYAPGQSSSSLGVEDGDSYSVGLSYTDNADFQASARFEHRRSSAGTNTVITASALGHITESLTGLVNYQQASASNQRLSGLGTTSTLRVGLAYRDPEDDTFNALLRYEYRRNPSLVPESLLDESGTSSEEHLFGIEAIYAPSWRWELYGKYAFRQSTSYIADDLTGTSMVSLAQVRGTYRIDYRWDVAAESRWISQPSADYDEFGLSVEAGYYLSPNLRMYGGYSLGAINDRDFGSDRSAGGFFAGITLKLDNQLFRDFGVDDIHEVAPPQEQESVIETATSSESEAATMPTSPNDSPTDNSSHVETNAI
jgi:hypothetical protein